MQSNCIGAKCWSLFLVVGLYFIHLTYALFLVNLDMETKGKKKRDRLEEEIWGDLQRRRNEFGDPVVHI